MKHGKIKPEPITEILREARRKKRSGEKKKSSHGVFGNLWYALGIAGDESRDPYKERMEEVESNPYLTPVISEQVIDLKGLISQGATKLDMDSYEILYYINDASVRNTIQ